FDGPSVADRRRTARRGGRKGGAEAARHRAARGTLDRGRARAPRLSMFNAFERAVAGRYLRARRGERFVSVIAGFSLVGIALGVATLIIVMSVMGGFKVDLLNRILGFNGHLGIFAARGAPLTDYQNIVQRIRSVPGVVSAIPVVDGQVLLTDNRGQSTGGLVRGISEVDLQGLHAVSSHILAGSLNDFHGEDAI